MDAGATNRKLGSDMAQSVSGGGVQGKDLSKADVSVNIYAFLKAQQTKQNVELFCAIGDTEIDGRPYAEIVEIARQYIKQVGGFEKFAEWGIVLTSSTSTTLSIVSGVVYNCHGISPGGSYKLLLLSYNSFVCFCL